MPCRRHNVTLQPVTIQVVTEEEVTSRLMLILINA